MEEKDWMAMAVSCNGKDKYKHFPVQMAFERMAGGIRGGAMYRCSICNGRKLFWKTGFMGDVKWEWNMHPNRS